MTTLLRDRPAFGRPGIAPRWTRSAKDAVGTAYSTSSRVWFTASGGLVNEVYYPRIDCPQVRDLQFLITDGETFFHDERRHLETSIEHLDEHSLGYRVVNRDPERRYSIVKQIVTDPHQACLLIHTRIAVVPELRERLRFFVLLAPHLGIGGWGNTANVADAAGREVLTAHTDRDTTWLAMAATVPFAKLSCGYVGVSDGWTDLSNNYEMDWEFDVAEDGNVALTGEIDVRGSTVFTLGLGFGDSLHGAVATLSESLGFPFARHRARFADQWVRVCGGLTALDEYAGDGGALYRVSHRLLLAHEDKTFQGAMIASMSIPWGETKGDDDLGGYHLVWTRDMVHSATALLASGNPETPLRALIYLACAQNADGGFAQNFWLDGTPYWQGIQLDEVAFPILLARRLQREGALGDFDPYSMVMRAAGYLVTEGPVTPQERWEENAGYSPSTLASNIAALTCAACFAGERGEETTARFLQEYADFLFCHIEPWTVTTNGSIHPDVKRHFVRIRPGGPSGRGPANDPDMGMIQIKNRAPGLPVEFRAKDIVDAGFLELVRYGILDAGASLVEDSLRVVDKALKVETPFGPCWKRYNHDGYGQRDDGGAYEGWGTGRAWPLLTGERGHYELAAGRDPSSYLRAIEGFANGTGLLPEQIWDDNDLPEQRLFRGKATGSAMPLMWAHAEYIALLRSMRDAHPFDLIPEVRDRYRRPETCRRLEVWKFNHQVSSVPAGWLLRVQAARRFRIRWTLDDWCTHYDTTATTTSIGIHFADIAVAENQRAPIRFTFFWTDPQEWEGQDFLIHVRGATDPTK